MRGTLHKIDEGWSVAITEEGDWSTYYPLHPDDVKQINADAQIFDNIEARIRAYPDVDFKFYEIWEQVDGETKVTRYAKLKPRKFATKNQK